MQATEEFENMIVSTISYENPLGVTIEKTEKITFKPGSGGKITLIGDGRPFASMSIREALDVYHDLSEAIKNSL